MENKEIEKLVGETVENIIDDGTIDHDTIRTALTLADKQGYMRGLQKAIEVLPKDTPERDFLWLGDKKFAYLEGVKDAHDAITRLKEQHETN